MVERVTSGRALEDDQVELKARWPEDHRKAARRVAGHANQAGGDTVLWLVGVDESRRQVVDAGVVEMSEWWPQVERCFDELAPSCTYLTVPVADGVVHALFFDTSRAPYMVTTDGRGGADREVPWRDGTRVRTARRSELLRSLVDEVQVPTLECFGGSVQFRYDDVVDDVAPDGSEVFIRVDLDLYLEALSPCTMPQHRWSATLTIGDLTHDVSADVVLRGPTRPVPRQGSSGSRALDFVTRPTEPTGEIVAINNSGLRVSGSDAVKLTANATVDYAKDFADVVRGQRDISFKLTLPLANSTRAASVRVDLRRDPKVRLRADILGDFVVRPAR